MAGSKKAFLYEDDFGTNYGVVRDESAAEAVTGSGAVLYASYAAGTGQIRKGIKTRYVNAVLSTDSSVRRVFGVGRKTVFDSIQPGTLIVEAAGGTNAGGTFAVLSKVGEKQRFLTTVDTGQTDGDQP